jgi:fucose permease
MAIVVGSAASGFGLSAVYPIFIASLSRLLGEHSRKLAVAAFAIAGLGGATLPWSIGAVANATGDMRWGLMVPVAGCVAMLVVAAKSRAMFETRAGARR